MTTLQTDMYSDRYVTSRHRVERQVARLLPCLDGHQIEQVADLVACLAEDINEKAGQWEDDTRNAVTMEEEARRELDNIQERFTEWAGEMEDAYSAVASYIDETSDPLPKVAKQVRQCVQLWTDSLDEIRKEIAP